MKHFLRDKRASVVLESAMAASFLILTLAGVIEITNTLLVGDLLQRAANRVVRSNALADSAASSAAALKSQCLEAINTEIGQTIDFNLAGSTGTCTVPEGESPSDFCLNIEVKVYDNPSDMLAGTESQGTNAGLGGDAKDMVVVTMVLTPQTALARAQQRLVGESGLTVLAVMRNERLQEEA